MKSSHTDTELRPLALPPRGACAALNVGTTKLYELLNANELEAFSIGRARRITVASLEAYVARQVAAHNAAA